MARMAYEWCVANPSRMLVLTSTKPRLIYHIGKRGEYVEFVTQNPKTEPVVS
jgi:hypothetical protein